MITKKGLRLLPDAENRPFARKLSLAALLRNTECGLLPMMALSGVSKALNV